VIPKDIDAHPSRTMVSRIRPHGKINLSCAFIAPLESPFSLFLFHKPKWRILSAENIETFQNTKFYSVDNAGILKGFYEKGQPRGRKGFIKGDRESTAARVINSAQRPGRRKRDQIFPIKESSSNNRTA
jgi:hypothetical protein